MGQPQTANQVIYPCIDNLYYGIEQGCDHGCPVYALIESESQKQVRINLE